MYTCLPTFMQESAELQTAYIINASQNPQSFVLPSVIRTTCINEFKQLNSDENVMPSSKIWNFWHYGIRSEANHDISLDLNVMWCIVEKYILLFITQVPVDYGNMSRSTLLPYPMNRKTYLLNKHVSSIQFYSEKRECPAANWAQFYSSVLVVSFASGIMNIILTYPYSVY